MEYQIGGSHYRQSAYQPIELIEDKLQASFVFGNIVKYLFRYNSKSDTAPDQIKDLRKVLHYVKFLQHFQNWFAVSDREAIEEMHRFLSGNEQLNKFQILAFQSLVRRDLSLLCAIIDKEIKTLSYGSHS